MTQQTETHLASANHRLRRSAALVTPTRYQHPLDVQTMAALRNTAGLEDLVRLFDKHFHERFSRAANVAGSVRVGPEQFPDLYELFRGCCRRLGVRPEPELYLSLGEMNAFTSGIERPFVTLMSDLVKYCAPEELEFIIGHELGHIRLQHVLYHEMAFRVPELVKELGIPIIGWAAGVGLRAACFAWVRAGEYSADRAGLLACQDLKAALRVMMKLTGVPPSLYEQMNPQAFLEQAREYQDFGKDWVGWAVNRMSESPLSHPWTVLRAAEVQRWYDSGEYDALLGELPTTGGPNHSLSLLPPAALPFRCPLCATHAPATERYCPNCGAPFAEADRLRFCPGCQAACPSGDRFCQSCGNPMPTSPNGGAS
jgi:Zn-dependent protease with chaperone function